MMIRKIHFLRIVILWIGLLLAITACGTADPASLDATLSYRGAPQRSTQTMPIVTAATKQTSPATSSPTTTATLQPTASLGVDPNKLTGLSIQFWHPWSGKMAEQVNALVEQYNLTNDLGIQVEATSLASQENLDQAVKTAFDEGSPPDLAAAYLFQALNWQAGDGLVDLQPYISDRVWGLSDQELADVYVNFLEAALVDGKPLGFPAIGSAQVLIYNQTWGEELGFKSPPETPEQLLEQACAAAKANQQDENPENDGKGGLILSTHYSPMAAWIAAFGGKIFDKPGADGNPYGFGSKGVELAFHFLRSLYDQGCAWLPEEPYPEDGFANRLGLFATTSVVNLPYQVDALRRAGNQDLWKVLAFPTSSGGEGSSVYGPAFEILKTTPEKQLAAWMFIRYMLAPENQALLVQASSGLPVSKSALAHLQEFQAAQPNWAAAQQLSTNAASEPGAASWKMVRWALSDAATQLFRSYFTIDKIPDLVKFLDQTAADLNGNAP